MIQIHLKKQWKRDGNLKWKYAMEKEIKSFEKNNKYYVMKFSEGKKLVIGRWVYTIKSDPENLIYKAFYIIKGYSQMYGTDYFETFAPTASMELEF